MRPVRKMYAEARSAMQPGDVIAFGGKGRASAIIKAATFSQVSHVGIVLQTQVVDEQSDRYFNNVIESTSLNGFTGVSVNRLSSRLEAYDGEVWWLPLSDAARRRLDLVAFWNWLFAQEGKPYDYLQALQAGLDLLDRLGVTYAEEDFSRLFCSELVVGGLRAGGVLSISTNPSEVTPINVCRMRLWQGVYQLGGETRGIDGVNTVPVLE